LELEFCSDAWNGFVCDLFEREAGAFSKAIENDMKGAKDSHGSLTPDHAVKQAAKATVPRFPRADQRLARALSDAVPITSE